MGAPYQNQTASGFNSSPPADDGSVTAANKVKWATILGQIGTPLSNFITAVNSAVRGALNVTPTAQSSAYTTTTADHLRTIEVTGTTTISLGDAATMVAASMGYEVPIVNIGTNTVTVAVHTATDTLAGKANGTMSLLPLQGARFAANSTGNGYDIVGMVGALFASSTNATLGFVPAGVVMDYAGSSAPTGWLECDGSAVSRTTYASLFSAIGTTWGAGDGSTTFNLPPSAGRSRIGRGTATATETVSNQAASGNAIPVASNNTKWITGMPVTLSSVSGYTGISSGSYYIVRASSTTVQFATSLANAQNGTVVTVTGTGSATLTTTFTARTIGETGGEEVHAMSSTELLNHGHTIGPSGDLLAGGAGAGMAGGSGRNLDSPTLTNTGGNAAMNIMQLYGVYMQIIKY